VHSFSALKHWIMCRTRWTAKWQSSYSQYIWFLNFNVTGMEL